MNSLVPARVRHLTRFREIATILARHGLGWVVVQLGLGDLVPFQRGWFGHPPRETPYTQAEHFRMAFEDLGAAFIKFGQILSTRADLLPAAYIAEFSKLQDAAPPVPYDAVARVIQAELGAPPEKIFAEFDHAPRASASIGQAHPARLKDGTRVMVKVQRPHVEELVERDLEVLADLANFAARHTRLGQNYDPVGLVEEFAYTLRNELDYTREGQNADRLRRNFTDDAAIYVPKVDWEFTTPRVLVMEEIRGVKINELAALDAANLDRHRVAENSVRIMLTEVFEHGFFHADPHPGNFFVMSEAQARAARQRRGEQILSADDSVGAVIGLMDYGLVGHLDDALRDAMLRAAIFLVRRDTDRLVDELMTLGIARGRVNRQGLKRDLDHFIANYYDRPLKELAAGKVLDDVVQVAFRHHLQFPSDLMLLFKVVAMSEGLGLSLDPEFKLLEFAEPYFQKFWLESRSPRALAGKLAQGALDIADLVPDLPHRVMRLMGELERGQITITVKHEGLDEAMRELERVANRVTLGVITAALIIGLSFVMSYYHPSGWEVIGGIVFTATFLIAVLFAVRLLWVIWRTGKR